jgi:5'-nucleotidase
MRILITNDDGIHAKGLEILEAVARTLSDDVWVIAPESDQSGVSHALSLNDPIRMRTVSSQRYAVKGTPTDCVIMAVRHILKDHKPDLILSGVNRGQNVSDDVTYSGTIAAAMEGTILGIPSIALSQAYGPEGRKAIHWRCAERYALPMVQKVLAAGIPKDVLININFPDCVPDAVQGLSVCAQGQRDQAWIELHERRDGRDNPYFWIGFAREQTPYSHGTDLTALMEHKISITPLRLNLTDYPTMTRYAEELSSLNVSAHISALPKR